MQQKTYTVARVQITENSKLWPGSDTHCNSSDFERIKPGHWKAANPTRLMLDHYWLDHCAFLWEEKNVQSGLCGHGLTIHFLDTTTMSIMIAAYPSTMQRSRIC